MKVVALIPARGGSKGIPRKNMKLLFGRPLIFYSMQAAKDASLVDMVIVSSDDDEILQYAENQGVRALRRPKELAQDTSPTEPALLHALEVLENESYIPDLVVLLQPTSPVRDAADIDGAIQTLLNNNSDSLLSVVPSHAFLWKHDENGAQAMNYDFRARPRRQDREPEFRENGSIYVTKRDILLKEKNRLGGKISLFVMDESKGVDLDTPSDFLHIEQILTSKET